MKRMYTNMDMHYTNYKNMHVAKLNYSTKNECKSMSNGYMYFIKSTYAQMMFALLLGLMLCVNSAFAAEVAATVFFKSGTVTADSSQHGLRHLEKDDSIYENDSIDTADNGRAQLRFTDGGLVSLMPGSVFSVEEYLFDEADEDSSAVFGLLKGGLRTVTGAIGKVKHEQYELKTPVATLGIRGTEFTVVLQNARTLLVHVGRGKVVLTNESGTIEVLEGQNAIVTLGDAPELTDQEPMFLATAPTGDDLQLQEQISQDPHITDVLTDVAPMFAGPASSSNSNGYIPVTPLPNNPGNVVVNYDLEPRILIADAEDNQKLFNVAINDFTAGGGWDKEVYGSNNYIEWGGYFEDYSGDESIGNVEQDEIDILTYTDYKMLYVMGDAMVDYVPAGTLQYSMDTSGGQITAYNMPYTSNWNVNKFDLGIDLASLNYNMDFSMTGSGNSDIIAANTNGSLNTGSVSQNFSLSHDQLDLNGSPCGSSAPCTMQVNGFLAGNNAQAAGVNFKVDATTAGHGEIYGAVPLKYDSGNTGGGVNVGG